jgi:hypothetical protein
MSYKDTVIARSPISYWRFGESSGLIAYDEMHYANAVYSAGVVLGQVNPFIDDGNTAAYIPPGENIVIPDLTNLGGMTTLIIEMWFKPSVCADGTFLISKAGPGGSEDDYYELYLLSDGRISFLGPSINYISTLTVTFGNWHHLYFGYFWNHSRIYLMIDGIFLLDIHDRGTIIPTAGAGILCYIGTKPSIPVINGALIIDELSIYKEDAEGNIISLKATRDEELRQEAIKWIKEMDRTMDSGSKVREYWNAKTWINHFFNVL